MHQHSMRPVARASVYNRGSPTVWGGGAPIPSYIRQNIGLSTKNVVIPPAPPPPPEPEIPPPPPPPPTAVTLAVAAPPPPPPTAPAQSTPPPQTVALTVAAAAAVPSAAPAAAAAAASKPSTLAIPAKLVTTSAERTTAQSPSALSACKAVGGSGAAGLTSKSTSSSSSSSASHVPQENQRWQDGGAVEVSDDESDADESENIPLSTLYGPVARAAALGLRLGTGSAVATDRGAGAGDGDVTVDGAGGDGGGAGGDTNYPCDKCHRVYTHRSSLIAHQNVHYGKGVTCGECGKVCSRASTLRKHRLIHEIIPGQSSHDCKKCGAKFRHIFGLDNHWLTQPEHRTTTSLNIPSPTCSNLTDLVNSSQRIKSKSHVGGLNDSDATRSSIDHTDYTDYTSPSTWPTTATQSNRSTAAAAAAPTSSSSSSTSSSSSAAAAASAKPRAKVVAVAAVAAVAGVGGASHKRKHDSQSVMPVIIINSAVALTSASSVGKGGDDVKHAGVDVKHVITKDGDDRPYKKLTQVQLVVDKEQEALVSALVSLADPSDVKSIAKVPIASVASVSVQDNALSTVVIDVSKSDKKVDKPELVDVLQKVALSLEKAKAEKALAQLGYDSTLAQKNRILARQNELKGIDEKRLGAEIGLNELKAKLKTKSDDFKLNADKLQAEFDQRVAQLKSELDKNLGDMKSEVGKIQIEVDESLQLWSELESTTKAFKITTLAESVKVMNAFNLAEARLKEAAEQLSVKENLALLLNKFSPQEIALIPQLFA